MDGEEEQLVLPEACSQGTEHSGRLLLVSEQDHLGMCHGAAEDLVDGAATDAADDVWEGSDCKGLQLFGCLVACMHRHHHEHVSDL